MRYIANDSHDSKRREKAVEWVDGCGYPFHSISIYFNEDLMRFDILEVQIEQICINMQVYARDRLSTYATFESACTRIAKKLFPLNLLQITSL